MRNIVLIRIPGPGAQEITISQTATWASVISQFNLEGRTIYGDGESIEAGRFDDVIGAGIVEMLATNPTKGN